MTDADVAWVERLMTQHQAAMHEPSAHSFVFRDYKQVFTSNPPKLAIVCPACGARGYMEM
jgi:hypothetical protein